MPRRPYRDEEPLYANMANWNDGYEYVAPDQDPRGPSSHKTDRLPERRNTEPRRRYEEAPRRPRYHSPEPSEDRPRDRSRDRPRQSSPPRAPRDRRYPPAARHGRPPLDTGYYDDAPRQRPSHSRSNSFSDSPARRPDDRRDDRHLDNRGRDPKPSLTRSKSMKERGVAAMGYLQDPRLQAAAAAAFAAGSQAAFRTPGAWDAKKGRKIATAALGAAALDAMAKSGRNGDNRQRASSRDRAPKKSSGKSGIGSKLGGFVLDQLVKKGSQGRH